MRRWHYHAVTNQPHRIIVTPSLVQILAGDADNFITNVPSGVRSTRTATVPRLGADVPRWYGETIGFWDKDALITWTSNIQGWKVHGNFEFSSKLQTIEIYTPNRDAAGNFVGLNHEGIFYDPEALVEPIRMVRNLDKIGGFEEGDPYSSSSACRRFSRERPGDASPARQRDRIQGAGHVRPPVGRHLGGIPRAAACSARRTKTSSASNSAARPPPAKARLEAPALRQNSFASWKNASRPK